MLLLTVDGTAQQQLQHAPQLRRISGLPQQAHVWEGEVADVQPQNLQRETRLLQLRTMKTMKTVSSADVLFSSSGRERLGVSEESEQTSAGLEIFIREPTLIS